MKCPIIVRQSSLMIVGYFLWPSTVRNRKRKLIASGVSKVGAMSDGNDKSLWPGEYASFFQIFMLKTYR